MPGVTKKSAVGAKKTVPAKTKRAAQKTAKKTAVAANPRPNRRLRPARYTSFRLSKRIKHPVKLPSAFKLAKRARQLIFGNWKTILGIVLVYQLVNMALVRGFSGGTDVRQLKEAFDTFFSGVLGHLATGATIFAMLLGTSTSTSGASGAATYQSLLILIVSLALVWAYRQQLAAQKFRIRDAYYKGMYPLIPVFLVLLVISLQLIPMVLGGWWYGLALQSGIVVGGLEKFLWGAAFFLLALLSFYMLSSSIFAAYIATLVDMTPMRALRSARELVRHRRWTVMRKVLFLPVWLLLIGSVIMIPFILFLAVAAQWVFFGLTMVAVAYVHAYMYTLYRELLREKN